MEKESKRQVLMCARMADEKKGQNLLALEVRNLLRITDYFLLVTANNRPQAQAIADEIQKKMREEGSAGQIEGYGAGWWILLDYGDFVVHIQQKEAREFYDLDHLWADAPRVPLDLAPSDEGTLPKEP